MKKWITFLLLIALPSPALADIIDGRYPTPISNSEILLSIVLGIVVLTVIIIGILFAKRRKKRK